MMTKIAEYLWAVIALMTCVSESQPQPVVGLVIQIPPLPPVGNIDPNPEMDSHEEPLCRNGGTLVTAGIDDLCLCPEHTQGPICDLQIASVDLGQISNAACRASCDLVGWYHSSIEQEIRCLQVMMTKEGHCYGKYNVKPVIPGRIRQVPFLVPTPLATNRTENDWSVSSSLDSDCDSDRAGLHSNYTDGGCLGWRAGTSPVPHYVQVSWTDKVHIFTGFAIQPTRYTGEVPCPTTVGTTTSTTTNTMSTTPTTSTTTIAMCPGEVLEFPLVVSVEYYLENEWNPYIGGTLSDSAMKIPTSFDGTSSEQVFTYNFTAPLLATQIKINMLEGDGAGRFEVYGMPVGLRMHNDDTGIISE